MDSEELPVGVAAPVTTVMVELPVLGFGVKLAVASEGRPLTLHVTGLLNPAAGLTDSA